MSDPASRAGLVIFDLDNTLVDRDRFFGEWVEQFGRERGLEPAELDWLCAADDDGRRPRRAYFELIRERLGLADTPQQLVDAYWRDQMTRYRCESAVVDGLRVLGSLGYRLAIGTNGGSPQMDKVRACGLDALVDAVCISGDIGFAKPDPRFFEAVAERSRRSLRDAWIVGDRPDTDIAGANSVDASSIWVSRGKAWPELAFQPTLIAVDAAGAMRLLADATAPAQDGVTRA